MRYLSLFSLLLWGGLISAQVYTVNSNNDADDGVCDAIHCSLREAINASEADGVPSTILFNIPGAGQQSINPTSPFPVVTKDDLTILGESQPGGAGTIVIDFNNRKFFGTGFWDVLGKRFYISGIDFTDYLFDTIGDHLFQFGDPANNSSDSRIFNCSFTNDNYFDPTLPKKLIIIYKADNMSISNCYFGTDHSLSSIYKLEGFISVESTQNLGNVTIDSNVFANKVKMIEWGGGNLFVNKNTFGALDTSKSANFLDPENAILGVNPDHQAFINDNFFFGFTKSVIQTPVKDRVSISKNRFYSNAQDISLTGNGADVSDVVANYARNGKWFLSASGAGEVNMERNNISLYDTVFYNQNNPSNQKIRHIDNKMTCINDRVIIMDPTLLAAHPVPSISTVNRNQITGTGNPNDSVVVYSNNHLGCPNTVCEAGIELGRTKADGAGNWTLNAAYPNKSTISAFQYDSNPNQRPTLYSAFSSCYQCPGLVKISFNPSLCTGQTVNYRGKVYSDANPYDSIVVKGDAVSICDSVIIVNVKANAGYRSHMDVAVCYQDTLRFGPPLNQIKIYKNHFDDSLNLKSVSGCDSIITFKGREVGVGSFNQTICDNASVTIFGTVFDKNKTSGTAVGAGLAVAGCDSIVFVQLMINNFTESFLNRTMCPGQTVVVGGQVFDQNKLKGDVTLPGASSTGCDSLVHVNLNYPNNVGSLNQTLCRGDSVFIIDRYFSDKNTMAAITIPNGSSFGCDSIINVSIGLLPNAQGSYTNEICRDDTLNLNGELFFSGHTTGTLRLSNLAANGCDSIVDVNISIIPDAIGNFDTTMCENQSRIIFGQTFSISRPSGVLRIPNVSVRMCDSFLNVNITFVPETMGNFTKTICRKDNVKVGNKTFDANNPTGTVRLVGGNSSGCDSVVNVALTINPVIQLNYLANDLQCNVANTGQLVLNDITGGSGNFKVSVDNGAAVDYNKGLTLGNLSQGNHTVKIIDQLSCDTTYNFTINNSLVLGLQLPKDTIIKKGSVVSIIPVVNFIPTSIVWDPPTFLDCTNCLNPNSKPDQTTSYTLTLTDDHDCSVTDNITITVLIDQADIYVPNVFSPNGDNINDRFFPVFKLPNTTIAVFRIFDRWGNLIFEHLDGKLYEDIYWDGTSNQEKMNPGVYVYAIQFVGEDGVAKWKTGDITLMR
jgi:gliding motility-associated-like protein/CSLREA domain-containing protein